MPALEWSKFTTAARPSEPAESAFSGGVSDPTLQFAISALARDPIKDFPESIAVTCQQQEKWKVGARAAFSEGVPFFHIGHDVPSVMFSELDADRKTPKQQTADNGVHLNPVPAKNTLLAIVFFSVLAAAVLYWLISPPAPQQASDNSPPPNAQSAARD